MDKLIIYNFSDRMLEGYIRREKVRINAGPSASFPVDNSLPITLWYPFNGKLVPGFNLALNLKRSHRYLLFFFPPAFDGAIELQYRLLEEEVELPQELIFENH